MKKVGIVFAVCIGVIFGVADILAAPFTNGSFESGGTNTGTFVTLNSPSSFIDNWTVDSGSVDWINSYWTAAQGTKSLDLSGDGIGSISQTFNTTNGGQYSVSFSMAGNPAGGNSIKTLYAYVDSGLVGTFYFDTTGKSLNDMGWQQNGFIFTASGPSANLTFLSGDNNSYGPALDNISVTSIPLPSTLLILGSGLITFLGLRRRLRG
jgi:choice-of-anchor C domain-containing protein